MKNFIHLTIVCLGLIFIFSCGNTAPNNEKKNILENFNWKNTLSPEATYKKLLPYTKATRDSFYNQLGNQLILKNQFSLLGEHVRFYQQFNDDTLHAYALKARLLGSYYNFEALYDSSFFYYENAISANKQSNNLPGLAESYLGMATNEIYRGNFDQSLLNHYNALSIYTKLNDSVNLGRVGIGIAIDHYYQKDFSGAIKILEFWQEYYRRNNMPGMVAEVQSTLTFCLYSNRNLKSAEKYAESALKIYRAINNNRDIAEALNNLALPLMATEQWERASSLLQESLELMEQAGDKRQIPIIRQNLANALWKTGKTDAAKKLLTIALMEAGTRNQKDAMANAYKKLYDISNTEQNAVEALKYYKLYKKFSDLLYTDEKAKIISSLNVKYEVEIKEQKINQLLLEKKLAKIYNFIYFIVSALLLAAGIVVTARLYKRNKLHKQKIINVQNELSENEAELKKYTKRLLQKNNLIDELEMKLASSENISIVDDEAKDQQISALYQLKILTDDDWTEFKIKFDRAYPGFINRLRDSFPSLAPGEQRQCLLTKLNMEPRECASMLGISVEGVKKNRYRLKKRFGLSEQESLDEFVKNFG